MASFSGHRSSRCRVLVVDDHADTLESAVILIAEQGHEVRTARTGVEALATGAAFHPELVLLDIAMPGMDGFQICAAMRATDWGRRATLVAVTGLIPSVVRDRCIAVGFDQYVLKPVDYYDLSRLGCQRTLNSSVTADPGRKSSENEHR